MYQLKRLCSVMRRNQLGKSVFSICCSDDSVAFAAQQRFCDLKHCHRVVHDKNSKAICTGGMRRGRLLKFDDIARKTDRKIENMTIQRSTIDGTSKIKITHHLARRGCHGNYRFRCGTAIRDDRRRRRCNHLRGRRHCVGRRSGRRRLDCGSCCSLCFLQCNQRTKIARPRLCNWLLGCRRCLHGRSIRVLGRPQS
jgi:hypothetical protein